jgi:uncharacterized protein YbbC (DUF1343 family)
VLRCIIFFTLLFVLPSIASHAATVKTGSEVLSESGFAALKGKRFALVTNQAALVAGVPLVEAMERAGVPPVLIFTPEHGFRGTAEDGVQLADSSFAGVPVKSL